MKSSQGSHAHCGWIHGVVQGLVAVLEYPFVVIRGHLESLTVLVLVCDFHLNFALMKFQSQSESETTMKNNEITLGKVKKINHLKKNIEN